MTEKRDYYEVLGVSRDAGPDDIKKAFRRQARDHHPDVNQDDPEAEDRFKELNEAYQVLSDPEMKSRYDAYGHQGMQQQYGSDFGVQDFGLGEIFDMFFGAAGRGQSRAQRGPQRGDDIRHDLELTLEEAATGVHRSIRLNRMEPCDACKATGAEPGSETSKCSTCNGVGQVRRQQQTIFGTQVAVGTCPSCNGEGSTISNPCQQCKGSGRVRKQVQVEVDIPAGMDTGMRVRIPGEGYVGERGGGRGDLYVQTHIKRHKFFERRDNDLWGELPISFSLAALGGLIEVPTLEEPEEMGIRPGTQSGEILRLRGKGMPDPHGRGARGDINVVLKVHTPNKLTDEQKTLLKQLAQSMGEEIKPTENKGFFEKVRNAFGG